MTTAGRLAPFRRRDGHASIHAMYRKIVVGYKHGARGDDALALARILASAPSVDEVLVVEALPASRSEHEGGGHPGLTDGWPPGPRVAARAERGASAAGTL